jgi:hypothetical protein
MKIPTRDEIEKELLKIDLKTIDNYFEDEEGNLIILDTTWELFDQEEKWRDTDDSYNIEKYKNPYYDFIIEISYRNYVSAQGDESEVVDVYVKTISLVDMFTHKEVIKKIKTLENLELFRYSKGDEFIHEIKKLLVQDWKENNK